MTDAKHDRLDDALAALPRDVPPERDLWSGIRAEIERTPIITDAAPVVHRGSPWWLQLAAGVLLVVATSFTTYVITRQSMQNEAARIARESVPAPVSATPAAFRFGQDMLGPDYLKARAELDRVFQQRVASLPPAARMKLQRNLADLRHAALEISATLAQHPSDPLLQDLLMSTYQSELRLLADVNEMTTLTATRTNL